MISGMIDGVACGMGFVRIGLTGPGHTRRSYRNILDLMSSEPGYRVTNSS